MSPGFDSSIIGRNYKGQADPSTYPSIVTIHSVIGSSPIACIAQPLTIPPSSGTTPPFQPLPVAACWDGDDCESPRLMPPSDEKPTVPRQHKRNMTSIKNFIFLLDWVMVHWQTLVWHRLRPWSVPPFCPLSSGEESMIHQDRPDHPCSSVGTDNCLQQ